MLKQLLKSTATMSFVFLASLPASAQVHVDIPLPGLEIRVGHRAPPPMRREVRPNRPGRDHIWVPGAWDWQNNDWGWVAGRWDRPAERHARWIRARYVREGRAWRYEPGHWSNQRVIESDDYRRWRDENRRDRGRGRDRDRDRNDR